MARYLIVLVVLAGCATPEERAARMDAMIAKAGQACEKLGFKPDTEAMANCKLQLLNSADANAAARSAATAQNVRNVQEATRMKPVP